MNEYQVRMRYAGSVLVEVEAEDEAEAQRVLSAKRKKFEFIGILHWSEGGDRRS